MPKQNLVRVHGTTIAWGGRGALLIGASGSGKSALALHLMALGCDLIADDQSELRVDNGALVATCPQTIIGKIEARGFGILNSAAQTRVNLCCCVDLDTPETKRLPPERFINFLDQDLRLFHKPAIEVLPFALLQYLKSQQLSF